MICLAVEGGIGSDFEKCTIRGGQTLRVTIAIDRVLLAKVGKGSEMTNGVVA